MTEILQAVGSTIGFPYLTDVVAGLGSGLALFGVTVPFLSPSGTKSVFKAVGIIIKVLFLQKENAGRLRRTAFDAMDGLREGISK